MKKIISILLVLLFSLSIFAQEKMPKISREFRGMWIASVANIDFPSATNLTADQQRAEIIKLLDLAQELKMNAVVFQARSMGDALYESEIEPSSYFLTGEMGKKLEFDPLKFAIDEAHKRGILLHAWFNPYRVSHATFKGEFTESHITKRHPEWVRTYNNLQILDPGEKDVPDYVLNVVLDVVKRYDIDGVHFDDYFYPYPDSKQTAFPDDKTWDEYKKSGGKLSRDDWRRKNVDDFIQKTSIEIKKLKPTVMFGISPLGIWKPDDLNIKGLNAYEAIFADSRKWLQEGWVDYLSPQLYWSSTQNGVKFPTLLDWWKNQNKKKRHIWAGIATYKVDKPDYGANEIANQITTTRGILEDNGGNIHFNAKPILNNVSGVRDILRDKSYSKNSVIPQSSWITAPLPASPELTVSINPTTKEVSASWKDVGETPAFRWVLYWKDATGWKPTILQPNMLNANLPAQLGVQKIAISSIDRLGNLSEPTIKEVK